MFELARVVAVGVIALVWLIGLGLTLAVLGALTLPMHAPIWATLSRVWAWALSGFLGALWAVAWRVWVAGLLARDLAITYLHTYRADRETARPTADGRHRKGFGRRWVGPGRHRSPSWA